MTAIFDVLADAGILTDESWRNDTSPSFCLHYGADDTCSIRIFVDYEDAAQREFPDITRYYAYHNESNEQVAATDDLGEIVSVIIREWVRIARKAHEEQLFAEDHGIEIEWADDPAGCRGFCSMADRRHVTEELTISGGGYVLEFVGGYCNLSDEEREKAEASVLSMALIEYNKLVASGDINKQED